MCFCMYLSISLTICLSGSLTIHPSICLSISFSIVLLSIFRSSVCLSVYLQGNNFARPQTFSCLENPSFCSRWFRTKPPWLVVWGFPKGPPRFNSDSRGYLEDHSTDRGWLMTMVNGSLLVLSDVECQPAEGILNTSGRRSSSIIPLPLPTRYKFVGWSK